MMTASPECRALLEGQGSLVVDLALRNERRGRDLGTLVGYVFDLLDPLGYTLAHELHRFGIAPNPDDVLRAGQGRIPLRPIVVGLMPSMDFAKTGKVFRLVFEIRPLPPSDQVRVLVAAGMTTEIVNLPVAKPTV